MAGTQFPTRVGGVATITAGTTQTQAGATEATGATNIVTTGNANDGVILTARNPGDSVVIINVSAVALKVYPPSGAAINGGSANAAVTVKANSSAVFTCGSSTVWGGVVDTTV